MNYSTGVLVIITGIYTSISIAGDHPGSTHHYEEEIIVSTPFQKNETRTALPINVMSGERLSREVANSLGDTLKNQIGIHNSSFGPGVGQAVIRGQSGNRVQVLQNSVNNVDVAAISPDHANGVEPLLASRIEVIRGPSTLLYGNGAIGGIVNVIDDRIPETDFERPEFAIEQSHNTVNEENKTVARLNATLGTLNLHLDAFTRNNDDVKISGFAIDEAALEAEQAHHEDEDHEEEPSFNSNGFIANSDAEADGHTLGVSVSDDRGFIGFSVAELTNDYGLPGGSHESHEHEDEHEDEGHEEDEEGQEFVRIDMEQTRYDLKGELRFETGFFRRLQGSINYTDYQHRELEIEPDGTTVIGTEFNNEGYEGRFTLTHAPIRHWTGVWGIQVSNTEFSALGAEAFIPETDNQGLAVFLVERLEGNRATWELGYRYERTEKDPGGNCQRNESTGSLSASFLYDLRQDSSLLFAVSQSQRAPTLEERFSNIELNTCQPSPDPEDWVPHAATMLLEIGNPDLGEETATNLEVGFRRYEGRLTGELSGYFNRIDDYIYLQDTGEFEEQAIATYQAEDAEFFGLEGKLVFHALQNEYGELDLSLQGDMVRAEFDKSGDVPRIPPARIGASLSWHAATWSAELTLTEVFDQHDTAVSESETDGYTLLNLYADYHMDLGDGELLFFARGSNLLDEEIRNHISFLKNFAPESGRGVRLGIRYVY